MESNHTKSGQLASVCRYWRSVITTMPSLWSTLRVGTWTRRQQVTTWLRRAYPFKVVIDTQGDIQGPSNTLRFAALLDALARAGEWHELTISSFPPETLASQLGFQTAPQMNMLNVLHVAAGCVDSLSFTHLLNLVPIVAPLSELRLYPEFASTYFLQSHWFPVLVNLRVLVLNGRGIHEPFGLLPAFTQLEIFEADHLPLPWYEPNSTLQIVYTLQKLRLRASSVQWMAGREFPCLEECAILLPHSWVEVKQHGVQLPACSKLTYHGYPMTTVQYFHAPQMKVMGLGANDCKERRVYQHLRYLCTLDETISKLTTLHLTLQCSEQAFVKVLKYLGPLQELVLFTAHHSSSWQSFLESLVATPSTKYRPKWYEKDEWGKWNEWCSYQTWRANVLPYLKYLGVQCPKGFSQSECLGNCLLFRLVAWTRAQSSSPLEHLKVWEGSGATENVMEDYIYSGYLERHLGTSNKIYESMIVRGMVTNSLDIDYVVHPLFHQPHLTALFRQLHTLTISQASYVEIWILPDLEQIKRLELSHGIIPAYSLNIELPLVHTLQWLDLRDSTFSWMLGRTFETLRECILRDVARGPEDVSGYEELQVGLPTCTMFQWVGHPETFHHVSCPSVQLLHWWSYEPSSLIFKVALKSLYDFLLNSSYLEKLEIIIYYYSGLDSLIQFVFCDSLEQKSWINIRIVEMEVDFHQNATKKAFLNRIGKHQQHYGKRWKKFMVSNERSGRIKLSALM